MVVGAIKDRIFDVSDQNQELTGSLSFLNGWEMNEL